MSMTIGKWRRLQQMASPRGTFSVLAIDHREPLRQALQQQSTSPIGDDAMADLKQAVVHALDSTCTAVLLDPETSIGPCVTSGELGGQTGLITALDPGSTGDQQRSDIGIVEGWDVAKAARVGASGVKLLLYYHPAAADAPQRQELVRTIGQACDDHDMPFFLEPLSCPADEQGDPLSSDERREVIVESARQLVPLGVDILKAEFPVDVSEQTDEGVWCDACEQLTRASLVPWVLLSAGVSFETFLRQTRVACEAGASGVMVGRAVWSEAVTLDKVVRTQFLRGTAHDRMNRLHALCDGLARPFSQVYRQPLAGHEWYKAYGMD